MSDSTENSKQTNTLGDQPATKDELCFTPYVIAMAEFLTHQDTKPPLTISIEGEWGSGKSSFMKQLEAEVKKKSQELDKEELEKIRQRYKFFRFLKPKFWQLRFKQETQTVEFNAWRHEKSESLWATFALSFLEQLSKNRNLSDILYNFWSYLRLIVNRLDWKDKPVKFLQTLVIIWLMATIIVSVPFVIFFPDKVASVLPWYEKLAGIVKTDSEEKEEDKEDEKKTDNKEDENNQFLTFWLQLGGYGAGFAGLVKLLAILKDLIGDPKMDLTQYLESPDYKKQVAFIEKFHEDFSKIVNAYVGENEKIYVFIDDLDRCELGKSADLLQALNMMISNDQKIIFILGMDREKVAAAISFKQRDVLPFLASAIAENQIEENENQKLSKKVDYGFSFLEKFVQLSFSVPAPSQKTLDSFVEKNSQMQAETKEKRFLWIPHSLIAEVFDSLVDTVFDLPERFKSAKYLPQKLIKKIKDRIFSPNETEAEESDVSEQNSESQEPETLSPDLPIFPIIEKDLDQESLKLATRIAAEFFDYNPRRLKQYINALRLRIYITYYSIGITWDETKTETITIEQISKFTALTLQYPRLLLAVKKNQELLAQLEKYAFDQLKVIQPNNSVPFGVKSTPNNQKIGSANYWISNYPKISKLLYPETNNQAKNQDNCIFQNASIKKLLEVSPQQSLPPKYFKLREFLAAKEWEKADGETLDVMLQVAGRERQGWLDVESIDKFPCKDLRIIDQLWVKYSDGKFGFSVQKKIFLELGGTREYDRKVWEEFGKKVGWLQGEGEEEHWVSYSDLFNRANNTHFLGHLPRRVSGERGADNSRGRLVRRTGLLLSRRDL